MKRLEILVPESSMEDVTKAIEESNIGRFDFYPINARRLVKKGKEVHYKFIENKVKIEFVVTDKQAAEVIKKIKKGCENVETTGIIFVLDVRKAIDVVEGVEGAAAIRL